jgi:hypothetical protein
MSKRAKRIIGTATLLVLSGAPMPATVAADELESFRSCGSDEALYDPSTDNIAFYYRPLGKYIVFPSVGQMRYLGRDYSGRGGAMGGFLEVDPQWRLQAASKAKELRATGRCKTNAAG